MYTIETKPSYRDRWMQFRRMLKIEPNQVGVVFHDGNFAYFLSDGWYPQLNRWSEQLVALVPIKLHIVKADIKMLSADGFHFETAFNIKFLFDPSKASEQRQVEAAGLILGRNPDRIIRDLVEREARYAFGKAIGQLTGEELLHGHIQTRLERDVRHHLQRVVSDLGVIINASSGILVESLIPPDTLVQVQTKTYQRKKTIELLENHSDIALQTYLLETFAENNNVTFLNGTGTTRILDDLYASAFSRNGNQQEPDEESQGTVIINVPGESNSYYRQEVRG